MAPFLFCPRVYEVKANQLHIEKKELSFVFI